MMLLIKRLPLLHPEPFQKETIRVLDIGCGEGAGMFGLYFGVKDRKFNFTGIDSSKEALKRNGQFFRIFKQDNPDLRVSYSKKRLTLESLKRHKKRYNFVLFINTLAEIISPKRIGLEFVKSVLSLTAENGLVIIIEPALKSNTRRLMQLRESMVKNRLAHIVLPCRHHNSCPLLKIEREWCHFVIPWRPPEFIISINQGLNREIDRLKFSYLVISRSPSRYFGYTVISQLLKEKGRKKFFICTEKGRVEVFRLNRDTTSQNNEFDTINSGDLIEIDNFNLKRANLWRIEKETSVKVLQRF